MAKNQLYSNEKIVSFEFIHYTGLKKHQNMTLKVNFLCQESFVSFRLFFYEDYYFREEAIHGHIFY